MRKFVFEDTFKVKVKYKILTGRNGLAVIFVIFLGYFVSVMKPVRSGNQSTGIKKSDGFIDLLTVSKKLGNVLQKSDLNFTAWVWNLFRYNNQQSKMEKVASITCIYCFNIDYALSSFNLLNLELYINLRNYVFQLKGWIAKKGSVEHFKKSFFMYKEISDTCVMERRGSADNLTTGGVESGGSSGRLQRHQSLANLRGPAEKQVDELSSNTVQLTIETPPTVPSVRMVPTVPITEPVPVSMDAVSS